MFKYLYCVTGGTVPLMASASFNAINFRLNLRVLEDDELNVFLRACIMILM